MRRSHRLQIGPVLLMLATAAAASAQNSAGPRLTIDLKPRQIEVGDRFQAVIDLAVPIGLAIGAPIFPDWGEVWGEAEILEIGPSETLLADGGFERFRQTLVLTVFTTGEVTLPPVTVELPTASEILAFGPDGRIQLTVVSVLPEGEEMPAPKPPAPPAAMPIGEAFWWTVAATLGLCLFAAALLVRRRYLVAAGGVSLIDPLTALRRALARLEGGDDLQAVIAGLSLELRRYLGRTFAFPAAESTTTEVRRRLQEIALPTVIVTRVDTLLRRCDTIKFARGVVEGQTCAAALAETAAIGEAIAAHLTAAAEEPDESAERRAA